MTTILIACDKFKGSLTAHQACAIIADTLAKIRPEATSIQKPLADGGDGFVEVLAQVSNTPLQSCNTVDAIGHPITADYAIIPNNKIPTAALANLPSSFHSVSTLGVIELAQAAGLAQLNTTSPDIWQANTAGIGRVIRDVLTHNVDGLLIGLGGSATHDLGLGALQTLGLSAADVEGRALEQLSPAYWPMLATFTGKPLDLPPIAFACDVNNPLLGSEGAAAVYGSQKGLDPDDLLKLDKLTEAVATTLAVHCDAQPSDSDAGAGAAGGFGYGFKLAYGDRVSFISGSELIQNWLNLQHEIEQADIIITGEGRFDASSLHGKGCGALLELRSNKPLHLFAGSVCAITADNLRQTHPNVELHSITPADMPIDQALSAAAQNIHFAIQQRYGNS